MSKNPRSYYQQLALKNKERLEKDGFTVEENGKIKDYTYIHKVKDA